MTRIKIVDLVVIVIFLFLAATLFNLEIIKADKFKDLSNKNCIRLLPQEGSRGRILDCEGNIIVGNDLCYDVMIMPQDTKKIDKTLIYVSKVLGVSPQDLKNTFKNNSVFPFGPCVIAKNVEKTKAIALEELKSDIGDIFIQTRPQRTYPFGRLACHLIGYLNEIDRWRLTKLQDYGYKTKDIVGFGGVEERYDYYLREEEGGLSVEVDHRGRFVRTIGFRPPTNGKDIKLTLDLKIQKIVEDKLGQRSGCVIVMDPYTGEVIAMASYPNFDPTAFVNKSSWTRIFLNSSEGPLINRAISGLYAPGSVFKLVLAIAGLQTGKINLSRTFSCSGSMLIGQKEFSCWDTHSQLNLLGAITHSCNVFFYKVGLILGAQLIHDYAVKLGFGRPTGIDLPYEEGGFVPSPLWRKIYRAKNWFDGDTANFSIGQGELLVTPIQIARMMAVFANKGKLVTPYVVKEVGGRDISAYQKKITRLSPKENVLDAVREGLRRVVSDPQGTANNLSTLSISVAGKTGTAQAPPGQPHGWFAGFFPFKNPKFVICVFLERGGAGYVASTLARQIIEDMIKEGLI